MTETAYDRVTAALSRATGYVPNGNGKANWRCPHHIDEKGSLTVTQGDDRVLLHCHAGCTVDEILADLQLAKADLFDAEPKRSERPELVATYDYPDETGAVLFQTVRMNPKDFRQRHYEPGHPKAKRDGWVWSIEGVRRVLYRLPRVLEAVQRGLTIYVVEGEKDVHALEGVGETATCNPMGAGKWRDEYSRSLAGGNVVVIADRDDPGRRHARQVAASLEGVAVSVRTLEPVEGKDIADNLAAGRHLDELMPLADLSEQAAESAVTDDEPEQPKMLSFSWVDEVALKPPPEPPALVDGLIRKGDLVVVGAARGVGKSWMAYNLSTLLARGEGLFLGALPVVCSAPVLIAQGELDPWGAWARWRRLCGEDLPASVGETFERWRLRVTTQRSQSSGRDRDGSGWSTSDESIDARLDPRVEATLTAEGFEVLLIDPWRTFYSGRENDNDQVEAALDKLRDLSLRLGTTVVIFAHLGKSSEGRDPEDLWRGASRLADWASVRVTLLPHYTESQREKQGMTRQQARRYVDAKFLLRNGAAPDDFSLAWNPENGWWDRWASAEEVAAGRRTEMLPAEVAKVCEEDGGSWPSVAKAAESLGVSRVVATRLLADAAREGWLVAVPGDRNAWGYRLASDEDQF